MKSFLLFSFVLIVLKLNAQNNDLNPNSSWHCWDLEGTSQCKETNNYNLYFNGDSLINGNHYFKLYKKGYQYNSLPSSSCNVPNIHYNYFSALVRYYQNKLFIFNGNADVLYLDYNLQIGDSIKNIMFTPSASLKITRIDSVNVNGNYLNRFFYKCTSSADTGYVIEKIGSNHGFISEFTPFFESTKELICYAENDITTYENSGELHSSCDMTVNVKDYDSPLSLITLYPNPANNEFTIDLKNKIIINKIAIHNYLGQTILKFDGSQINQSYNISQLKGGIYFVEIETDKGTFSKKIIKH